MKNKEKARLANLHAMRVAPIRPQQREFGQPKWVQRSMTKSDPRELRPSQAPESDTMPRPLPAELPEQAAHSNTNHENREQKLIHARVLGYLILERPSMRAAEFVAKEVNACRSEDQLDELGEEYLLHYLRTREA